MWFVAITVVLFTAIYFVLSFDEKSKYRLYVLPAMFLFLALLYWQDLVAIFFAVAALFVYLGQREHGKKAAVKEEGKEKGEKE